MIIRDRHYRICDLQTNSVVLVFYNFPGRSLRQSMIDAIQTSKLELAGYYRIDRMVYQDGVARWKIGLAVNIP